VVLAIVGVGQDPDRLHLLVAVAVVLACARLVVVGRALGVDHRAHRHLHDEVLAALAVHLLPAAGLSALGHEDPAKAEIEQRGQPTVGDEHHVTAFASVAARRPAARDVLLAAPTHDAVAAPAGAREHAYLVDELHGVFELMLPRAARETNASGVGARGMRIDGHDRRACATTLVEADAPVDLREQREVLAGADALAGLHRAADLAHDDVAGLDLFATELLDSTVLRVGVAPVLDGAVPFFVCHGRSSARALSRRSRRS